MPLRRRQGIRPILLGLVVGLMLSISVQVVQAANNLGGKNHWSDGNQPRAYVTIVDYTPAEWPVFAATAKWATEPNIDVYYDYQTCHTGHCIGVRVETMAPSCDNLRGYMQPYYSNNHYDQTSYVRFNSKCGASRYTNRNRRSIACHELGHVMGLAHDEFRTISESCMVVPNNPENWVNRTEFPSNHDFSVMHNSIYDHNDN
jgi:hypothetical protein